MYLAAKEKGTPVTAMLQESVIEAAKNVPISAYLDAKGIQPVSRQSDSSKNKYVYCSPLSNEKTPSFFVSKDESMFNDYSTGEKGDVIRLVRLIERVDFVDAVKTLQRFTNYQPKEFDSIFNSTTVNTHYDRTVITAVRQLCNPALIKYVEQVRRIPYKYASSFLKQVHYDITDNRTGKHSSYYGVGFRTDCGSFAIRSNYAKRWIGQATITTIRADRTKCINLFEGFFDFLSACVYYDTTTVNNTTIVLNSISHINRALPSLLDAEKVFCYLDNDNAGKKALDNLRSVGVKVVDRSDTYQNYKDFNEYMQHR